MKKNLWIWALAAFSMAACTSEDVPTQEQVVTENDFESPDGRIVVQLSADGLPTPTANVGGRAIGPIEGKDIVKLDSLGIFALARGGNFLQHSETNTTLLLNNVLAAGKETTTLDPDLHKESDNVTPLKRISLYSSQANKIANIAAVYYYPITATYNYDFYGYHPYQNTNIEKEENEVIVHFDMSQGDIDLITGKAAQADPIANTALYVEEKNGAAVKGEGETIWQGYNARYIRKIKYSNELVENYTTQAETDGITRKTYVPNIHFKHRTTQLRFFVVANDKQATEDKTATQNLKVGNITLKNVPVTAAWRVTETADDVTNDIEWGVPTGTIGMKKKDGVGAWIDIDDPTTADLDERECIRPAVDSDSAVQAGYLMVAPQTTYKLGLTVYAPVAAGSAVPPKQDAEITIQMLDQEKNQIAFEEGKYYNIYIQLNALQEVNIHAELVDWVKGDDVFIPVGEDE